MSDTDFGTDPEDQQVTVDHIDHDQDGDVDEIRIADQTAADDDDDDDQAADDAPVMDAPAPDVDAPMPAAPPPAPVVAAPKPAAGAIQFTSKADFVDGVTLK